MSASTVKADIECCLTDYLNDLVVELENTNNLKQANKNFDIYFREIRKILPKEKTNLLIKLDDSYTAILLMYQEYFYKQGFKEGYNEGCINDSKSKKNSFKVHCSRLNLMQKIHKIKTYLD
ncbi:MAG: hypothetical protein Q8942_03425 [Bacillota bacterium]|nr:hypothetical protein [Bacillota bacterium]